MVGGVCYKRIPFAAASELQGGQEKKIKKVVDRKSRVGYIANSAVTKKR